MYVGTVRNTRAATHATGSLMSYLQSVHVRCHQGHVTSHMFHRKALDGHDPSELAYSGSTQHLSSGGTEMLEYLLPQS